MYYVYLLLLVVTGLLLLTIPNYLIYKIVKEQDKIVYIKGYKAKWKPLTILSEVVYCIVTYGMMIVFIPAIIYYLVSKEVDQKKLRNTFAVFFSTPIIGIILPILWLSGIQTVAMNHDLYAFSNLLSYLRIVHIFATVPFYVILMLKQYLKLLAIENTTMHNFVKESEKFNVKDSKRKLWPKVKLEEEFSKIYLVGYQNEEEWNNDRFTIMNYKLFYKLIVVFSSTIVLFTSIILSVIYFDILNRPFPISPTNYEIMVSPAFGDLFIYFYIYFAIFSFLIIALLNLTFIFNGKIVLKDKQYNEIASYHEYVERSGSKELGQLESSQWNVIKITQKIFVGLFVIGVVGCLFIYPLDSTILYENLRMISHEYTNGSIILSEVIFDDYEQNSLVALKDKYNYVNYSREEKYGYVMHHHESVLDDLEDLGYGNENSSKVKSYQYDEQFDIFNINIPFTNEYRKLYPVDNDYVYIYVSDLGFNLSNIRMNQRYHKSNVVGNHIDDEYIAEYTPEELALYNEMVDTVYDLTDTLFAMEMEDQGIELQIMD